MSSERTVKSGSFRALLSLVISIIALILAIMAFERTGGKDDLNAQIKDLQIKIEAMRKETARRVDSIREETGTTLERIGKAIRND